MITIAFHYEWNKKMKHVSWFSSKKTFVSPEMFPPICIDGTIVTIAGKVCESQIAMISLRMSGNFIRLSSLD